MYKIHRRLIHDEHVPERPEIGLQVPDRLLAACSGQAETQMTVLPGHQVRRIEAYGGGQVINGSRTLSSGIKRAVPASKSSPAPAVMSG